VPIDPQAIRAERHIEIGEVIHRDADLLTEQWIQQAVLRQPNASHQHRGEMRNRLPEFLRALGRTLMNAELSEAGKHAFLATEHGGQRWKAGWSLNEVIRDYQILRYLIQSHLAETLQRTLTPPEIIALGLALDEAVEAAVTTYIRYHELHVRTAEERVLASELIAAEQRERRRLAADLHDYLAQLLVVCKMRLAQVEGADDAAQSRDLLAEMDDLLDESLKYTRTLIAELSPGILYRAGMAAAVAWLAERMREQHGLDVEVHHDGPLPELPEETAIQIFLTIRELLLNVVKHAQVSQAVIKFDHSAGELIVNVEDQGVGISQWENDAQPNDGTFGLASARERLEMLGGRLEVLPGRPQGTQVKLMVPLESPQAAKERRERQATESVLSESPRSVRVLLADDHQMVREGLRIIFDSEPGFEVVGEAANGVEAVDKARALHPDVVVMDVNMPQMNGIEATRRITAEFKTMAVVGLSVDDNDQIASSMRDAGAVDFLVKGSPADDLCRAFRAARPAGGTALSP
jgi:signal transduction histidine kinase/CheY-like chemotaxis protein